LVIVILGWFGLDWFLSLLDVSAWMVLFVILGWFGLGLFFSFLDGYNAETHLNADG
jgi:hypothetical protein